MEKIKSLLHPHGHDKDRETAGHVSHDTKGTAGTAAQSNTATSGTTSGPAGHQTTPIYNEMTGHNNAPKFSNTPHVGTDGPIGGARVAGTSDNTSHIGDGARSGDSDISRPQVSSGAYDGNSEASIKSGVIGFSPGSAGQQHAARPGNSSLEDGLERSHVVGEGNAGTNTSSGLRNEVAHEQPSVLPVSSSTGHSSSTQQPYDSNRTGTDRSFPLAGGVTSGTQSTSTTHTANTSERESGFNDRRLGGDDRHGRAGLAGAAAVAAGTAAATHSRSSEPGAPQAGSLSDRNTSPTGHTHFTTSVPEHNIHPDALHAAGVRPVRDSDDPAHGPPYETPHLNTGTMLDYEKAYGSDPHTHHTGLLDYRPHAHRSDTSPHIPGEFPSATPDHERSGPILAGTNPTSGTTGPSTSHDLRHTGSLDDPTPRSTDQSGHHLGRDAAIAGGVGAAGLGAAAHHNHGTSSSGSGNLYDEKNPYSSKALDPRVTGGESRPSEQHAVTSTSQPLSSSSAPVPPQKSEEGQHNYGRDAAIAGGALGAGALAGTALSGDRHRDTNLADSPSLSTSQHTTGTANPSTVGTSSTSHQLPSSSAAASSTHQPQHHYGRDAGLAGAGAATAGGLAYAGSHDQPLHQRTVGSTAEDPASKTIGPHKSNIANILDPRVQPDPAKQKDHTTTGPHQSDTLNRADPRVDDQAGQHHYGRDAAVAGGAGAAGYGAYEAAKAYGDHRSTQPGASMQDQRYDPSAAGAHAPNPVPASSEYNYHNPDVAALAATTTTTTPGHHGSAIGQAQQPYTTAQLAQSASSQPPQAYKAPEVGGSDLGPRDNSSRNAALGAGAGLAGATAVGYGLSQHGDRDQHASALGTSTQPGTSSLSQPAGALSGQQYPHNTEPGQSHTGRDAALVGGAGAAAGAGAGYAYGQRAQPQFDPKEQERLEKETAKRQHELEKKHDKDIHKLEKEHEKDLKKHEKEAAKHDEEKEKKGGILGFLHRDKSKKEKKDRSPESSPRHSAERRSGELSGDDKFGHGSGYKGRNLLHKEPPEGHPAREALHANDRVGTDGPIGADRTDEHHYGRNAALGGGAVGAGALGAHELSRDRTATGTAPGAHDSIVPGDHASSPTRHQTTLPDRTRNDPSYGRDAALAGGAVGAGGLAAHSLHNKQTDPHTTTPGNTAAGPVLGHHTQQHQPAHAPFTTGKREHIGIDGPIGDPNLISGDRQTRHGVWGAHPVSDLAQDRTVIEPRTGLPMNVGRYGDGAGGTDGGPVAHRVPETVEGLVQPGSVSQRAETDWEGVGKKNTIF